MDTIAYYYNHVLFSSSYYGSGASHQERKKQFEENFVGLIF